MAKPTTLYLVRHGVAGERGQEYPDDSLRPLTAEGRARTRQIGAGLVALGVELDVILTSPFTRARQTADILAGCFKPVPRVTELDALAVGATAAAVFNALAAGPYTGQVALVGHMPGIGLLARELLGTRYPLEFKKGGVACIDVDGTPAPRRGQLSWFVPPRLLRLAGSKR